MSVQKDDSEPVTTEEYRSFTSNTHPINNLRIISSKRSVYANTQTLTRRILATRNVYERFRLLAPLFTTLSSSASALLKSLSACTNSFLFTHWSAFCTSSAARLQVAWSMPYPTRRRVTRWVTR